MAERGPGAPKRRRLSRSGEFERVYRDGSSHANRFLVFYAFPRRDEESDADLTNLRLGVSVGRKVGGAVERNRVKRCLRDAFWQVAGTLPSGYDFVIVARPGIEALVEREGTEGLRVSLESVIRESGLLEKRSP